ncbi:MAG: class I tRNA ligase family protein, partial [Chloroflexi bacterium]|nr:class I tRNA ligase family protein [Chloroflexota bacterium]
GKMINSGPFDGTESNGMKGRKNPAIHAVLDWLAPQGFGQEAVNYRLRDWLISRQRYWGSPIPMIHRADGQVEPVKDADLPVELPGDVVMTGVGNPLAQHETFVHTTDAEGNPARRETDTMDTFMCSSWYQLRYLSPAYDQAPFDPEEAAYWLPVDVYTGGAEHATMHLLYTRFFTKAMRDLGIFDDTIAAMRAHGRDPEGLVDEPMLMLRNQGQILGEERPGDVIAAWGQVQNGKLFADRVEVIDPDAAPVTAGDESVVIGEIMKRTENLLTVATDTGLRTVEVKPEAQVNIPSIEGTNNVNQLRHHLEIQRMSKSKGNVVNPDELVSQYGADTVRAYLLFGFDWTKGGPWDSQGIQGPARWINEVWDLVVAGPTAETGDADAERKIERRLHQTINKVKTDMEAFSFNTAVAALMEFKNDVRAAVRAQQIGAALWREVMQSMMLMMAPITPHMAEELWERLGGAYSVHQQLWPAYDAEKAADDTTTLVVMRNGKPIDRIEVPVDIDGDEARRLALESNGAKRVLNGSQPKKVIYIAGRAGGGKGGEPKVNIVM